MAQIVSDCWPANREHELGLGRHETVRLYLTEVDIANNHHALHVSVQASMQRNYKWLIEAFIKLVEAAVLR